MKKYISLLLMSMVLPVSAMAASDLSSFDDRVPLSEKLLREYKTENPNVVFRDRNIKERVDKFYAGLNGDLSFYSGKYKQSNGELIPDTSENFRFKPVVGLDISFGYRTSEQWRFDANFGYVGKYLESEYDGDYRAKTDLSLETFYIMANAYRDISHGFYAGFGAGLAFVNITVDDTLAEKTSKVNTSPIGAGTIGWTYMLDEKIDFDIHYRLALYDGGKLSIGGATFDAGLIINNSLSVGARYHF